MLRGKLPFSAETQDGTLELLGSVGWFHHDSSDAMPAVFLGDIGRLRRTVKCDVSYSAKPFAEVSQGIIDFMKAMLG